MDRLADRLDPRPNPWASNPQGWVQARLREHLWSKQVEIAGSVIEHRRTAVKSCHGVGKSFLAARLICWWIDSHPPGEAFVVSTAPSNPQVEAILWREINKAAGRADPPFIGRVLTKEWKLGNELIGYGRKPADTDTNGFQGIHARYVLVVLDEACGIPTQLWVAANALATNDDARLLAIGNPDDPTSHFRGVCQPGSGWNVIRIAASDSPNFTDEPVPTELRRLLVSQAYLDDLAIDVGVGSPIWTSKVDGEFPEDSSDGVVPASAVAKCRIEHDHVASDLSPVELGVDVGGSETGDATVIRARFGQKAGPAWRCHSAESEEVADEVAKRIVEVQATRVKIDSIGIGWGVAGHLNAKRQDGEHTAEIVKVNVGEASTNPARFPRLRDQIWWEVGRQNCEQGTWDLSAIDDRTAADLMAPKWSPDARGRIQVEKKDETRKRLGRSPDDGDALLLAFFGGGHRKRTMRYAA